MPLTLIDSMSENKKPQYLLNLPQVTRSVEESHTKRKRRYHYSSYDSSFLEPAERLAPIGAGISNHDDRAAEEEQTQLPLEQIKSNSKNMRSSISEPLSSRKLVFERRPRHKTREDLYEPKKKKIRGEKQLEERPVRKRREKKGDRKKAAKRAGENLMKTFTSKSIAKGRLTVSLMK